MQLASDKNCTHPDQNVLDDDCNVQEPGGNRLLLKKGSLGERSFDEMRKLGDLSRTKGSSRSRMVPRSTDSAGAYFSRERRSSEKKLDALSAFRWAERLPAHVICRFTRRKQTHRIERGPRCRAQGEVSWQFSAGSDGPDDRNLGLRRTAGVCAFAAGSEGLSTQPYRYREGPG